MEHQSSLWRTLLTGLLVVMLASVFAQANRGQAAPFQHPEHNDPSLTPASYLPVVIKNSFASLSPLTPAAYLPLVAGNYFAPAPLWRFGAAKALAPLPNYVEAGLVSLRLGWYVDWTVTPNAPRPYGMEYVPIVRVKQWKLENSSTWTTCCVNCPYVQVGGQYTYTVSPTWRVIRSAALANPGMVWVIGNEIERVDWGQVYCARQDEILPEVYATAYHDIRQAILNVDPNARFAIGGVIQATPLRLAYLNRVWNAYQQTYGEPMPVDVWNVHAFVLREERGSWGADIPAGFYVDRGELYGVMDNRDFSIAWQHIRAFRTWMKEKGQQNKPLIITEYGVNMPPHFAGFSAEEVRDYFMYPSFNHFLNQTDPDIGYPADAYRLVQRWNWYSLDDDSGKIEDGQYHQFYNGNLLYSGLGANALGLSPLGSYWQAYVGKLPPASAPAYSLGTSQTADQPAVAYPDASSSEGQSCQGRWIRLVFTEPSSGGTFLEEKEASRPVREELFCLSPQIPSQK